jgi:hypothetical protein
MVLSEEVFIAIDSTLERRRGPKIQGLTRQRDAVLSTKSNKVLSIGLYWLVCAITIRLPFTTTRWALPFLSILMPPKRPLTSSKNQKDLTKKSKYKTSIDWTCQVSSLLRRWAGKLRKITIVADSAFACFDLLYACADQRLGLISRLRLDARLNDFVSDNVAQKRGRKRVAGVILPKLSELAKKDIKEWEKVTVEWYGAQTKEIYIQSGKCLWYYVGFPPVAIHWVLILDSENGTPVALFSNDLSHMPKQIIEAFVGRWALEVTFEESRRHLGMETQRQWSDKAIERTTPIILASFSIITVIGIDIWKKCGISPQKTSWYKKNHLTFSDVLSSVREPLVRWKLISLLGKKSELTKINLKKLIDEMAAA